jgi:hypothetical protein
MPLTRPVGTEPLLVIFQFTQAACSDVTGNEIVVTIRRTDQDPATANEQFVVECKLAGGEVDGQFEN